jgi:hypothetical protein
MLTVVFYHTEAGSEPVREWLQSLSLEDRRTIGVDLWTVQTGWPRGTMAISAKKNPHDGSTLEDWLREEGTLEVRAEAYRRIKRWQLDEEMKRRGKAGEALPPRKRA